MNIGEPYCMIPNSGLTASQPATLRFYFRVKIVKFMIFWRLKDNAWQIHRVLSLH
ncbi:hypothetical protein SAMN04487935_2143 [Flavobacterium noncentrifugens]|uniref:Uncharacterized protein n=1 Tax=Flavobacterium noncentrifugens TaxID=1128970 RepID=A0A1G8Y0L8_9FLAO|nr:hypothetical protein SAMN04487935_2143 [Flavobacterium noncentrifugens]